MPDFDMPDYEETDRVDEADVQNLLDSLFGPDAAPAPEAPSTPFSGFNPEPAPAAAQAPASNPEPSGGPWMGFNPDRPYAVPDLRDDAGGRKMEGAMQMVANLFGVGNGRAEVGTAGGAYRDDWERRNPAYDNETNQPTGKPKNFDDTVIDYRGSGIDTSGMERGGLPTVRVNAITGAPIASEQINDYGDLRSIGGRVPMRDDKGEVRLDDQGRTMRYDLPGWNGQQRFGGNLRPDRLENGQEVRYDPTNNLTFGMRDGQPDRLLPGGLGYQGGASGSAYGLNPTTMKDGRPVFYDEQGNRTFERNGDRVGRNLGGGLGSTADRPQAPQRSTGGGSSNLRWMNPNAPAASRPTGDADRGYTAGGPAVGGPGAPGSPGQYGSMATVGDDGMVTINPNKAQVRVVPGSTAQAIRDENGRPAATIITEPNGTTYYVFPDGTREMITSGTPMTASPVVPTGTGTPVATGTPVPIGTPNPGQILGGSATPTPTPSPSSTPSPQGGGGLLYEAGKAAGGAAIAGKEYIDNAQRGNEDRGKWVWDTVTQSWKTQAELAARGAGEFGSGFGSAGR